MFGALPSWLCGNLYPSVILYPFLSSLFLPPLLILSFPPHFIPTLLPLTSSHPLPSFLSLPFYLSQSLTLHSSPTPFFLSSSLLSPLLSHSPTTFLLPFPAPESQTFSNALISSHFPFPLLPLSFSLGKGDGMDRERKRMEERKW